MYIVQVVAASLAGLLGGVAIISANRLGFRLWEHFYSKKSRLPRLLITVGVVVRWIVHVGLILVPADLTILRPEVTVIEVVAFGSACISIVLFAFRHRWIKSFAALNHDHKNSYQ